MKRVSRRDFLSKGAKAVAVGGAGLLAACGKEKTGEAPAVHTRKTFRWKMVTTWPPNFPVLGESADFIAKWVEEMSDGQYIKDFKIELLKAKKDTKTGYVKFSVVLQSRSQYKFNVVDEPANAEKAIMQLYFNDKRLVSNFENGKHYKSCGFVCGKTGVYNLVFSFKGGAEGCSSAVLSLVKQFSESEMKGF